VVKKEEIAKRTSFLYRKGSHKKALNPFWKTKDWSSNNPRYLVGGTSRMDLVKGVFG
jgi:hypothetical protein